MADPFLENITKPKRQPVIDKSTLPNAVELAEGLKNQGNDFFKTANYDKAIVLYTEALGIKHIS